MKTLVRAATLVSLLLGTGSALTQSDEKPKEFKPFKLIGDWQFLNTNSGAKYGGDIAVSVERVDEKGVMRGRVSYDGRQTNDKCGTKALFTDEPVDAEIIRVGKDFRIDFEVKCSVGKSPRAMGWTLSCTDEGVCTFPSVLPWGKGGTTLRVQQ